MKWYETHLWKTCSIFLFKPVVLIMLPIMAAQCQAHFNHVLGRSRGARAPLSPAIMVGAFKGVFVWKQRNLQTEVFMFMFIRLGNFDMQNRKVFFVHRWPFLEKLRLTDPWKYKTSHGKGSGPLWWWWHQQIWILGWVRYWIWRRWPGSCRCHSVYLCIFGVQEVFWGEV